MTAGAQRASGKEAASLAFHRYGFGSVADSIAEIAPDPRGALLADLDRPAAGYLPAVSLPSSGAAARAVFDFRAEQQAQQKLAQRAQKEADANGAAPTMSDASNAAPPNLTPPGQKPAQNK